MQDTTKNRQKLVYIIGAGRSGTTLLDIILGNAPIIFSAGELNRFTKRNGIPHEAIGENSSNFWQQVTDNLAREGFHNPAAYHEISIKHEYHSSFKQIFLPDKRKFQLYANYQKSLINAIFKLIDEKFAKHVIIDSSKYPLRGYFLSKIFQEQICYIYLKRDPLTVVDSFQKKDVEQPSKSRLMANLYLLGVNSLAQLIIKKLRQSNKVTIINYEDLLRNPGMELSKIEADLNIDLSVPKQIIDSDSPLKVGYLFDGNRLRLEQEVTFRKGATVKSKGNAIDKFFNFFHTKIWYQNNQN